MMPLQPSHSSQAAVKQQCSAAASWVVSCNRMLPLSLHVSNVLELLNAQHCPHESHEGLSCCSVMCACSPHVNVISGSNGSGKSAALQAMQCCLGVKARNTGRGENIKQFIKSGEHETTVRVCDAYTGHKWATRAQQPASVPSLMVGSTA
jgi:ABC-type cobalamin/Fe3+-siderophores transport system ATPase subunit